MTLQRLKVAVLATLILIAYVWASHEDYREAQRSTEYHWRADR